MTAEEIWQHMPDWNGKEESVHLASLPTALEQWEDEALGKNWSLLLDIRSEVTKALEAARAEKRIGHPLDAAVTLYAAGDHEAVLAKYCSDLRDLFIVSAVEVVSSGGHSGGRPAEEVDGLSIRVDPAQGTKCQRCWVHDPSVGTVAAHPEVCSRCARKLAEIL
jgi:isoleucyl-tRNA synthetase